MTPVTPGQAAYQLECWADDAENENYHTEAAMLRNLVDEVQTITERTLILVPLEWIDEVVRLLVVPPVTDEDRAVAAALREAADLRDTADAVARVYYDLPPTRAGDALRRAADRFDS